MHTSLPQFIAQARTAPQLSREEEQDLLHRWQSSKERAAGNRLVESNMRHVVSVATRYRRYDIPLDVLVSEGCAGMLRAMEKFDPAHGTRFSTYATYWIRSFMMEHILRSRRLVGGGIGVFKTRTYFKLRRERARAFALHGEGDDGEATVAERMGLSRRSVTRLTNQLEQGELSLNAQVAQGGATSLQDSLAGEDEDAEQMLIRRESAERSVPRLQEALKQLDRRERYIVEKRLMSDPDEVMPLSSLGEEFGVSRERVRQIEHRAKMKLRKFMNGALPADVAAA